MIAPIIIVILGESFSALGQLLFKKSTNVLGAPEGKGLGSYFEFAGKILRLPGIWFGLLSMAAGLVIWLFALSWFDLSMIFPIGSVQYILVLFASRIFLGEKIDGMKLIGTFLVAAGIMIVAGS